MSKKSETCHDKPFFARFLEAQFPKVRTDLRAGKGTRPLKDGDYTLKYPSDNEEDGGPF